jgi:hypothetical protein
MVVCVAWGVAGPEGGSTTTTTTTTVTAYGELLLVLDMLTWGGRDMERDREKW